MKADASWTFAPGVLTALAVYLGLYVWRWRRVRNEPHGRGASRWHLAAFCAGIALIFIALVSPVDRLGEQLFVMHMVQHILIVDLGPILIMLGLSKVLLRPIARYVVVVERRLGWIARPAFAVLFYAGTLWVWHIPAMYQLSLENDLAHVVQHVHFMSAGLLFWWHLVAPLPARHPLRGPQVVFYLAATKMLTGALASLITFSDSLLYDFYVDQPRIWGLTAIEDKRLAGSVMMVEELIVITVVLAFAFARMLAQSERDQERSDRLETG